MIRNSYPELPRRTAYPDLASLRSDWDIPQEAFDQFLAWLCPDHKESGHRYEQIRNRLIRVFTCRGCDCPEDLADETINRVTIKARDIAGSYTGEPQRYFYGVARRVFLEYKRTRRPIPPPPIPESSERKELELQCLEQCMQELPGRNRGLISEYHREEKRAKINLRKQLARELKIEFNALRIRVHRILRDLRICVFKCLKEAEME